MSTLASVLDRKRAGAVPVGALAALLLATPLTAQVGPVIHGRVEDSTSREPVAGARVLAADSSAAVFTDSFGVFAIQLAAGVPLSVRVEQYGYESQRFDLPDEAPSSVSVLLLEPAPIEIEGVSVVAEGAVESMLRQLRNRRNAYLGSVVAFDRTRLQRFAPTGSALDFILQRFPTIFGCDVAISGLCVRGRVRTPGNPDPVVPVRVCVDAWESWGAISELGTLDIGSVALVEVFGRGAGGIRVYTPGYLLSSARAGRNIALPLWAGC